MAVAECNYKEIDCQLKEQFIHGLNDKVMLEEIIRELTARNNQEQTSSEGVLAWVKWVETQRALTAILNDITKTCQSDKVKMAQSAKGSQDRMMPNMTTRSPCRYCSGIHVPQQCPAYGKMCTGFGKRGHYKKVCRSRKDHVVHKIKVEVAQESQDEQIETVSINSVCLNQNCLVIMAYLDTIAGKNVLEHNQLGSL